MNAPEKEYRLWYNRAVWRGEHGLRKKQLARHPLCDQCGKPANVVDHRKPHRGDWFLFCGGIDMENLRSLCKVCHDRLTALFDGALHPARPGKESYIHVAPTGDDGRQYVASTVSKEKIDIALDPDAIAALLSGM